MSRGRQNATSSTPSSVTRVRLLAILVSATLLALAAAAAPPPAAELATTEDWVPGEIVVKFAEGTATGPVEGLRRALGAREVREIPGIRVRQWRLGKGLTVEQALEIVEKHASKGSIEYAEPNYLFHTAGFPDDLLRSELWGLHNVGQASGKADADIDAPEAWTMTTGTDAVLVAIVDTGIDAAHPDLQGNIDLVNGRDFVNGDDDPDDDNGHGTHVAGTIGAVGNNGLGVAGVCWRVKILPVKGLNSAGSGDNATLAAAIQYAGERGARVISASWGGDRRAKAVEDAIARSGALFVAAAGNAGTTTKHYPAAYTLDNIVSVAATDRNDRLATFSSRGGDWVDLGAPGVDILSTYRGQGYRLASGTSMATPHVSGVAALVLSLHPGYTPLQVKSQLLSSVDPLPDLQGVTVTGGRLNAARAVGIAPATPADESKPDAISDLVVESVTTTSVTLSFTAPADGGEGSPGFAYLYDLRHAQADITEGTWPLATPVAGEPVPGEPGTPETVTVADLTPGGTYFFALKAFDGAGNVSDLSAVVETSTETGPHWELAAIPETGTFYHAHAYDPSSGNPAIAFSSSDGLAKLARWNGKAWSIEKVAAGGTGVDVAFDPFDGRPSLAWGSGALSFAHWTGSAWKVEAVEKSFASNDVTSLVYAPDGSPSIAYRSTQKQGSTRYAKWSGTAWVVQVVDGAEAGRYNALAYDRESRPAIAYSADVDDDGYIDTLKLARWTGASWDVSVVESGTVGYGVFASLAFDSSGAPVLAHGNGSIRYLWRDGPNWVVENVAAGYAPSLVWDGAGPLISFRAGSNQVRLARRVGPGEWTTELIETVSSSWTTDLVIDPSGRPSVSYRRLQSTGNQTGLARWVEP
jgi:subtilisin family serine protease